MFQPTTSSPRMVGRATSASEGAARTTARPARRRSRPTAPQLLWHERLCTTAGSAVQLRVPVVGPVPSDLAARLSARLDAMWTGRPSADGVTVTSVAAVVGRTSSGESLIVFISLDRLPNRRRIDDARMARELQQALEQCTAVCP